MGKIKKFCAIISGAPNNNTNYLQNEIDRENTFIICADLGYKKCIESSLLPDIVIGDFDSSPYPENELKTIKIPTVKDDSDTFFCLKKAIELGYNDITIYNAIGSRADHTWANILCLDFCNKKNVSCKIVDENNKIYTVSNKLKLEKGKYDYFSVFAFLCCAEGVSIKGAAYEINNRNINIYDQYGLSNEFKDNTVYISVKKGTLLIIESKDKNSRTC